MNWIYLATPLIAVLVLGHFPLSSRAETPIPEEGAEPPPPVKAQGVRASGDVDTARFAVAWSSNEDPKIAGKKATKLALRALGTEAKSIVFYTYFQDPDFTPKWGRNDRKPDPAAERTAAKAVDAAAGGVPNIGARARSLVNGGTMVRHAVAVMAIGGRQVEAKVVSVPLPRDKRREPGEAVAKALADMKNLKLVISISHPSLSFGAAEGVSVEDYIRAILAGTPEGVTVVGGNAMPPGDVEASQDFSTFINGKPLSRHAVVLGVGGPLKVFSNHTTEFVPSEKTVTVTKAEGKWVIELNGRPAESVYRELYGMKADDPLTVDSEHPVGVIVAPNKVYLRMILNWVPEDGKDRRGREVDVPKGSLRFISPIVEGTKIKVLRGGRDADRIVASAKQAYQEMMGEVREAGCKPAVSLVSDCCARGRRLRLFRTSRQDEVVEAIVPATENRVAIFGFYAFGELGPIRGPYQGLSHQYQQHTFVAALVAIARGAKAQKEN